MRRAPQIGDRRCFLCERAIGADEHVVLVRLLDHRHRPLLPGRVTYCDGCAESVIEGALLRGIGVSLT